MIVLEHAEQPDYQTVYVKKTITEKEQHDCWRYRIVPCDCHFAFFCTPLLRGFTVKKSPKIIQVKSEIRMKTREESEVGYKQTDRISAQ